jgi:hypothetical protein
VHPRRAGAREYRRALTAEEARRLLATAPHPRQLISHLTLDTELSRREAAELRALMPDNVAPFQLVFPHVVPRVATIKRNLARAAIPFVDELGR